MRERRPPWAGVLALALVAPGALAQPAAGAPEPGERAGIEHYLADRGLRTLLADYLRARLKEGGVDERIALADRLGKLYVALLTEAKTPDERRLWEERSTELLAAVPEADSFDLRISLATATYFQAEEIAERHRLRLASSEEIQEAERVLRAVQPLFREIGSKVHARVEGLERREARGDEQGGGGELVVRALAEARRLRSLAMYYSGWSNYYTAMLTGQEPPATEALRDFGWILNAVTGRPATIERLPVNNLRYEHVARAAMGCALCVSLKGNDVEAGRWLDAIETAAEVQPPVLAQVFARRLVVLGEGRRWADLELIVRRARQPERNDVTEPLSVGDARLLAVLTLEALRTDGPRPGEREMIKSLAESAFADLVALGEVEHVRDLVTRYGTAPIGDTGFIVHYIRAIQAYQRARDAHAAVGQPADEPATDEGVVNRYQEAGASLEIALASPDGDRFAVQRSNAGSMLGLALFYAGDLERAADTFESASSSAASPKQAEEALWLAVVALDRAVENARPSLIPRRDRLAALYLQTYPGSERAAKLLLRQATAGLVGEGEAAEVLLKVGKDSPLYPAARRQAARLLYALYRKTRAADREFAGVRFVDIAEEALALEAKRAVGSDAGESAEASRSVVLLVRQILDALLGGQAQHPARAEAALAQLDGVMAHTRIDLGGAKDEITFRRFQIALARNDLVRAGQLQSAMRELGGRFADAADRQMYRRALTAWGADRDDVNLARALVEAALSIATRTGSAPGALADDGVYAIHSNLAGAAATLWRIERDAGMRDLALRIDRLLLASGRKTGEVLRRHAELAESTTDAGAPAAALDAWRGLLSGLQPGSPGWFEARYHTIRLLRETDVTRAREAMAQHKLLYPDFGPDPWGEMLRELDRQMGTAEPAPSPSAPPAPVAPGGGDTAPAGPSRPGGPTRK